MRLSKFLSLVSFITFFSLLYVYQQTEIFRLAYIVQRKSLVYQDFLDRNTLLRYNIKENTSLVRIDSKVSDYAAFEIPQSYRLVRLTNPSELFVVREQPRSIKEENIAFRLFGIKREALGKTISPSNTPPSAGTWRISE
jgi:hypothetical protein